MAHLLKLVNLTSYISPLTRNTLVEQGQVCKFSSESAERVKKLSRKDAEDNDIFYFREEPEGTAVNHDFSNREDEANGAPSADGGKAVAPEAPVKASRPAIVREEANGDETGDSGDAGDESTDPDKKTPPNPETKTVPVTKATTAKAAVVRQQRKR